MTLSETDLNLTPEQLDLLAQDRDRWKHISGGGHLDDWLAFGPGLVLRRTLAMQIADTNKPEGRRYTKTMAALLERDGLLTMPTDALTHVLWLYDSTEHMTILKDKLAVMTAGQRSRVHSPLAAKQIVQRVLKARGEHDERRLRKNSQVSDLRQKLNETTRLLEYETELRVSAEANAAPLHLLRAKPKEIVATFAETQSLARIKAVRDEFTNWIEHHPNGNKSNGK